MSDGGAVRFDMVRLPRDTARMIEALVEKAATWGGVVSTGLADSPAEREIYRELCYARKWLSEHVELLCAESGVKQRKDDQLMRFV